MSSDAMQIRDAALRDGGDADAPLVPLGCVPTRPGLKAEAWRLVPLRRISDFITKGSTPTTYGFKWESSGILFLRSECVSPNGLDLDQSMFISPAAHEVLRRSEVRDGDILITITGYVGRVVLLRGVSHANINQHIARVRISARDVDPRYVYHVLSQRRFRQAFESITTGQAYPQISLQQVREAEIPLPELLEQRAIAEALSDVDGLLGALEVLIAKKRVIKQATMQQLLTGKARLSGFSGEWETRRLEEVAEIASGATPSTQVPANWDGDIPWCTPTDITGTPGKYLVGTERRITRQGLASCAARLLPRGALLLCSRATVGELKIARTQICTNQGFKSLVCRAGASNEFLYYLLLTLKHKLIERASGSTFLEIGKRDVASLEAQFPRLDEQIAIATVLSDMDAEIGALEARCSKARAIKQGMMQQLLTGRVRLVKLEVDGNLVDAESSGARAHSKAFNEAVVISAMAERFGSEQFPLGRKRYTKLSYLFHRHTDGALEDYLKKAAGPYNPKTKYCGPERIATENGYVREQESGKYRGFVSGEHVRKAQAYFEKWYGPHALRWLEQFRYTKNDELELLATVDMAAEELRKAGEEVNAGTVKDVIRNHSDWKAKLDRAVFSDARIAKAIEQCQALFWNRSP